MTGNSIINRITHKAERSSVAFFASRISGLLLGWVLCEVLVRVLIPTPIFYSKWFTSGVHQPDQELGFVLTPNYSGAMRHADGVWMEPICLNGNGFRLAATTPSESCGPSSPRIVMLGGASMAFSFGLSDSESIHHQTAGQLSGPSTIELIAWPGFTISQDLVKLDRFLDGSHVDQAVVFAYGADDFALQSTLPETIIPSSIPMTDGVVLPQDNAAMLLGAPYYHSVMLAGASRWWTAIATILGFMSPQSAVDPIAERQEVVASADRQPVALLAARQLHDRGISKVIVVALPHQTLQLGPQSLQEFAGEDLPDDGIAILDLRRIGDMKELDWIAGGHYGPHAAQAIATRIAEMLQ